MLLQAGRSSSSGGGWCVGGRSGTGDKVHMTDSGFTCSTIAALAEGFKSQTIHIYRTYIGRNRWDKRMLSGGVLAVLMETRASSSNNLPINEECQGAVWQLLLSMGGQEGCSAAVVLYVVLRHIGTMPHVLNKPVLCNSRKTLLGRH